MCVFVYSQFTRSQLNSTVYWYKNVGEINWKMIPSTEDTVRETSERSHCTHTHTHSHMHENSLRGMLKHAKSVVLCV